MLSKTIQKRRGGIVRLAIAQFNLGACYGSGTGLEEDDFEAVYWFQKAAAQGNADACFTLGMMYAAGKGVKEDYDEAMRWYREAAFQGAASLRG